MILLDVTNFGALGDGLRDNSVEIQKAIDECSNGGGGIVQFPSENIFMTGPFDLKSNVTMQVESNCVVIANPDESVYVKSAFRDNLGEGTIWIGGENAENVAICGEGVIDGNGIAFMGPEEKAAYALKEFDIIDPRPHLLTLVNVKKLVIKNITFKNSAYWGLHLVGCNDVKIDNMTILNDLKIRNSDGIDLDHSKNVRIDNCYIESGDDCICFKTRREYAEFGATENIIVSNCIMTSTSCSIKLGSENMDAIRNVIISKCIIKDSNRSIGIQNRDEGVIENIVFENIFVEGRLFDDVWWGKAEPIYVTAYKRKASKDKDSSVRFAEGQTIGEVGEVRNIVFSNISCRSENGIFVGGEKNKISNVRFENVNLKIEVISNFASGVYDLRPSDTIGLLKTDTSGFYLDTADRIFIKNCSLQWGENKAECFRKAIFAENVNSLQIEKFSGDSADGNKNPFDIKNCEGISIK